MEHIKNFLRQNGFVIAAAVCVLAAGAAGLWAVGTIRTELDRQLRGGGQQQTQPAPHMEPEIESEREQITWQQQTADAANEKKDVPKPTATPSPKPSAGPSAPSGDASGSGSVSEPSALQIDCGDGGDSAAGSCMPPVPGRILTAFSGDELVYNDTLCDWRTHNGTDYGCAAGDEVLAPTAGTVTAVREDGGWGPVVELEDAQGRTWRLCGVADCPLTTGQRVAKGDALGRAAAVGCESVTGPHIHMELVDCGRYQDPARALG